MPRPRPEPGYWNIHRSASNSAKPATTIAKVQAHGWSDHRPNDASSHAMPPAIASQPHRPVFSSAGMSPSAPNQPKTEIRMGGFLIVLVPPPKSVVARRLTRRWARPSAEQLRLRGRELLVRQDAGRVQVAELLELRHVDAGSGRCLGRGLRSILLVCRVGLGLLLRSLVRVLLFLVMPDGASRAGDDGGGGGGTHERPTAATHHRWISLFS